MEKATYIIKGDAIFTATSDYPISGAVIVKNDRIIDVVSKDKANDYMDENTIIYDYGDQLIMPGFIDAHTHYFMAAVAASEYMNTELIQSANEEECVAMMKEFEKGFPDEKRLFGLGWYPVNWNDAPLPTKASLDEAFPDKSVYLFSADCHTAWVNTPALKECGITKDTKVHNGEIGIGDDGEPNGLLFEMDATSIAFAKLFEMDKDRMKKVYSDFNNYVVSSGVTSLSEMTANEYNAANHRCYDAIKEIEDAGDMDVRLHLFPQAVGYTDFTEAQNLKDEFHSDVFQVAGVKGFVDGVMSTYTAYLLEPYYDRPDTTGEGAPVEPKDEMEKYIIAANAAGFPVRLHCIGDAAVRMALDMYEKSNEMNPGHGLNNTIEHIENINSHDIPRFKELNVIPSMQPLHLIIEKNEKFDRIGLERSKLAWAHNSIFQNGAKLAFGSDYPVVDLNPFPSIYAAMTRCDENGEMQGNNPEEKISLSDSLICYTKYAAEVYNRENDLGTLEVGKLADIVVVDRNLFEADESEIAYAKPALTMMGGKVVYKA